ncbi:MAG TPA: glycosyl hydrolase 53 family protein, partial [Actinomycetes bacterium]|nr:glycosyl hydrolase 53 family protein [Actinomycetes bacterium]
MPSYYPFWHGPLEALRQNLDDLATRYGKDIVVAEAAYPWTLADATRSRTSSPAAPAPRRRPTRRRWRARRPTWRRCARCCCRCPPTVQPAAALLRQHGWQHVPHRQDPEQLAALVDDQVADAVAGHLAGRLDQVPVRADGDHVAG